MYTFSNIFPTFCLSTSLQSASIDRLIHPKIIDIIFFCRVHFFHCEPKKKIRENNKILINYYSLSTSDHFVFILSFENGQYRKNQKKRKEKRSKIVNVYWFFFSSIEFILHILQIIINRNTDPESCEKKNSVWQTNDIAKIYIIFR